MSGKRRRAVTLGVLGIVGAIFLVDRLIGQKPAPSAASSAGPDASAFAIAADPAALRVQDRAEVAALLSIAELADEAHEPLPDDLRDLFRLPEAAASAAAETAQAADARAQVDGFEQRHALRGVMLGREPRAVIDGRPFAIGEELDGFIVETIERDVVTLTRRSDGAKATLRMPVRELKRVP
jgi:hypothetical protein